MARTARYPEMAALAARLGDRAAVMYTFILAAKMNDVVPQARLADVRARIAGHPAQRLDALRPWNWKTQADNAVAA